MPIREYKIGGQVNLGASVLTDVYEVPADHQSLVGTISVCNRSTLAATFRLSAAKAGAADDPKQYFQYGTPVQGNQTEHLNIPFTLGPGDVIRAYSTLANISVSVFVQEDSISG